MIAAFSRRPQALLLDIDNTVYPYDPCHAAGLKHAFVESRQLNLWTAEHVRELIARRGVCRPLRQQDIPGLLAMDSDKCGQNVLVNGGNECRS